MCYGEFYSPVQRTCANGRYIVLLDVRMRNGTFLVPMCENADFAHATHGSKIVHSCQWNKMIYFFVIDQAREISFHKLNVCCGKLWCSWRRNFTLYFRQVYSQRQKSMSFFHYVGTRESLLVKKYIHELVWDKLRVCVQKNRFHMYGATR